MARNVAASPDSSPEWMRVRPAAGGPGPGSRAEGAELGCGQDGRVAVGQEDGPYPVRAIRIEGDVQVLDDLVQRAHPEGAPLVHAAEGALVVRACQGRLDDQRSSLARGAIDET